MQRQARRWRRQGVKVGLVPTMGYLHAGHLSLVQAARRRVGRRGVVVLSVYVNPTQFAPHEDLAKYPRDLARDRALCRAGGVDVLFVPTDPEMYVRSGETGHSTYVVEEAVGRGMEGAARPTHFRGGTTGVAKPVNLDRADGAGGVQIPPPPRQAPRSRSSPGRPPLLKLIAEVQPRRVPRLCALGPVGYLAPLGATAHPLSPSAWRGVPSRREAG